MNITDVFSAASIAVQRTEVASNKLEYVGVSLFPPRQKMGLDLKWIKTSKGLPVSLAPSNFDATSILRSREGFSTEAAEMAFFRESMLLKERDEQDMQRVQSANDPYAASIMSSVYDDVNALLDGADVVPERMRMQLLAPTTDGSPRIVISANGVQYSYNYDPNGTYKTKNYKAITTATKKWSDATNSDPLSDVSDAQDAVENATGTRPVRMLMSKATMNLLKKNANIKSAILSQNTTANVLMTDARVRELFNNELGIDIIVYNKKYKNEAGTEASFYPDNYVTLLPDGALGTTWYGMTPEERMLNGDPTANARKIGAGVMVTVTRTTDPVNTKTTVSEICLPSYERMDETYVIKVA